MAENLIDEKHPDLVIVMLGTNDLLEGRPAEEVSTRMENYLKELLRNKETHSSGSPPPLKTGDGSRMSLKLQNHANWECFTRISVNTCISIM